MTFYHFNPANKSKGHLKRKRKRQGVGHSWYCKCWRIVTSLRSQRKGKTCTVHRWTQQLCYYCILCTFKAGSQLCFGPNLFKSFQLLVKATYKNEIRYNSITYSLLKDTVTHLTKITRFVWNESRQKYGVQNNLSQEMIPEHLLKHNSRWKVTGAMRLTWLLISKEEKSTQEHEIFSERTLKGLP